MGPEKTRVLVIGAGQAGFSFAATLRQFGFAGDIALCGDEAAIPYHRPPLSKAYLKGDILAESLSIRPHRFYDDRHIRLMKNSRATAIDLSTRRVTFEAGPPEPFDVLVIATGSRPRRLAAAGGVAGVHGLRSLADADILRGALRPGARILLVGGGYIGLEVAAAASAMGARPIVLEREERLLPRVASRQLSDFFQRQHELRNVEILTGADVKRVEVGANDRVVGVRLNDGNALACDAVLACIGGEPNDELGRDAGLECDRGIVVDIDGRTSDPSVFAIGDVTRRPLPLYENRSHRVESVPNAIEQARQAAAAIMGMPRPQPEVPWFWSDQFDVKLKIAGLSFEPDEILVRGEPGNGEFSVLHLKDGRLVCLESVNTTADFMTAKLLISRRTPLQASTLANTTIPLKSLVA